MSFTMDDVMQVLQIVKECKDAELHIDTGDMKLSIIRGNVGDSPRSTLDFSNTVRLKQPEPAAAPAPTATAPVQEQGPKAAEAPTIEPAEEDEVEAGLIPIKANVTSVFYRRPGPDEPPFVEVGDDVEEDSVVCLLEVMKCFRQVTAGVKGRIERICVESNNLAEEGTVLFWIRPA
jgi:acetyl-CoA carboxylase biotin carboxyl carrier protein